MGGFPWTARTRRLIFVVVMLVVLTFPLVTTLVTRAQIERSGVDVTATVVQTTTERGRLPGRVPAAGGDRPRPGHLLRRGRPGDVREGRREQGDRGAGAGGPPGGPPGRGRDPQQGAVRHGGRRRRPRAGGGPVVGPARPPPPDRADPRQQPPRAGRPRRARLASRVSPTTPTRPSARSCRPTTPRSCSTSVSARWSSRWPGTRTPSPSAPPPAPAAPSSADPALWGVVCLRQRDGAASGTRPVHTTRGTPTCS